MSSVPENSSPQYIVLQNPAPPTAVTTTTVPTTTTKKVKKRCSGWCWPLLIYIALAFLSILNLFFFHGEAFIFTLVSSILFYIFWGGIMYLLCYHCHNGWAWFLLFLPFILIISLIIFLLFIGTISFVF